MRHIEKCLIRRKSRFRLSGFFSRVDNRFITRYRFNTILIKCINELGFTVDLSCTAYNLSGLHWKFKHLVYSEGGSIWVRNWTNNSLLWIVLTCLFNKLATYVHCLPLFTRTHVGQTISLRIDCDGLVYANLVGFN